jgi:hypothetical protein
MNKGTKAKLIADVFKATVIRIANRANRTQSNIDQWYNVMLIELTQPDLDKFIKQDQSYHKATIQSSVNGSLTDLKGSVHNASQQGFISRTVEINPSAKLYKWVNDSSRVCSDCASRDGRVETLADWEDLGTPKSGFSVCGEFCHCRLEPVN